MQFCFHCEQAELSPQLVTHEEVLCVKQRLVVSRQIPWTFFEWTPLMFCILRGNIWLEQTYTLQLCSQLQISFPLSLLSLECTEFPDLKCLGPYQTSGTESKICWIIKFYPRTQQGVANENPRAIAWVWKFHLCANYDYVCL